jgi:UDP-glucose 4-epimerase
MSLNPEKILVIGGAGYIGSHMVKYLGNSGYKVVVLDNLSTGFLDSVVRGEFIKGDMQDSSFLESILKKHNIDTVFHFASSIQVGESIINPSKYYRNNVLNTINLVDAMRSANVDKLIFSSTAAVYGEPEIIPIPEEHPRFPINPYGRTKSITEDILYDYFNAYGLNSFVLRYFNAAGADPDGEIGERHNPETHLIPLILQVASGRRSSIAIFGNDYETPDGTCIRDYIHVMDLAVAHEKAYQYLKINGGFHACNLGTGHGYTVQEVISAATNVTGNIIHVEKCGRRTGDPAILVADSTKAQKILNWKPCFSDLDTIVTHAWQWEMKQS